MFGQASIFQYDHLLDFSPFRKKVFLRGPLNKSLWNASQPPWKGLISMERG